MAVLTATASAPTLVASECFGPTVQGEGPSCGRRCSFIRLGGCNLHCDWCDTKYTWDASQFDLRAELSRRPVTDLIARALQGDPGLVVISGGEPLLHQGQAGWRPLLQGLWGRADVEIETNGTVEPSPPTVTRVARFNVSPKLAHAGDPESLRVNHLALAAFARLTGSGRAIFKFVCRDQADIAEAAAMARQAGVPPSAVWIMPEGVTASEVTDGLRRIADPAIAAGFNLTTRLHVLAWGTERGR